MAQTNDKDQSSLSDFSFDEGGDSWFGITPSSNEDETSTTIKEVKGQAINKGDSKPSTNLKEVAGDDDEDDEEEVTFFEEPKKEKKKPVEKKPVVEEDDEDDEDKDDKEDDEDEDEEDKTVDNNEDDEEDEQTDEEFYTTLTKELKEKGIFQNVEIKEGEKIDEEKFFELQDEELEARIEETFEAFSENMDEDGKDFIKFKKDGGKTADFLALYANKTIDLAKFDENDPKQVEKVLAHYYTVHEELDAEELADKLEWLKDGGKEKAYAVKFVNKMQKDFETKKTALLEAQAKAKKDAIESAKKFDEDLKATLAETESVGVFSVTKNDQKELAPYITKPVVKVGKNDYIPQFQSDLAKILKGKTKEDKKKLAVLAKIVKEDFNLEDLVRDTNTKVTTKVKSKIRQAKAGVKGKSSGSSSKRSLSDFFS